MLSSSELLIINAFFIWMLLFPSKTFPMQLSVLHNTLKWGKVWEACLRQPKTLSSISISSSVFDERRAKGMLIKVEILNTKRMRSTTTSIFNSKNTAATSPQPCSWLLGKTFSSVFSPMPEGSYPVSVKTKTSGNVCRSLGFVLCLFVCLSCHPSIPTGIVFLYSASKEKERNKHTKRNCFIPIMLHISLHNGITIRWILF